MAVVISLDAAWTYPGCRQGAGWQELGLGTAVVAGADGRWWRDFAVGQWDEAAFLRLYARLPAAARYSADKYGVYNGLPANRHEARKGREVNRNEGAAFGLAGEAEPAGAEN